jgi:hypothetical protein
MQTLLSTYGSCEDVELMVAEGCVAPVAASMIQIGGPQ